MEEKKIEIITKNSDGLYNKVTVHKLEDGSLSKTGDEIAEILLQGDKDSIDTSDFTELDLADGHEYGKIFVNIPEEHEDFDIVKDAADDAGSYLDEMESPLSKEDEEDRDSFIENLTKDNWLMSNEDKFKLIEKTIKDVKGEYPIDRLILDCADKLSISTSEVKSILIEFDSELLRC